MLKTKHWFTHKTNDSAIYFEFGGWGVEADGEWCFVYDEDDAVASIVPEIDWEADHRVFFPGRDPKMKKCKLLFVH